MIWHIYATCAHKVTDSQLRLIARSRRKNKTVGLDFDFVVCVSARSVVGTKLYHALHAVHYGKRKRSTFKARWIRWMPSTANLLLCRRHPHAPRRLLQNSCSRWPGMPMMIACSAIMCYSCNSWLIMRHLLHTSTRMFKARCITSRPSKNKYSYL